MFRLISKHKKLFILGIIFIALSSLIQISFEFLKGALLDSAFKKELSRLAIFSLALVLAFIFKAYTHFLYTDFYFRGKNAVFGSLRGDFTKRLLKISFPVFKRLNIGDYIFKYTGEIDLVEREFFQSGFGFMQILFETLFGFLGLFILSCKLALACLLLLLPTIFLPKLLEKAIVRLQKAKLKSESLHLSKVSEWIRNIELIKNYSAENSFTDLHAKSNEEVYLSGVRSGNLGALSHALSSLLSQIGVFGIIVLAIGMITKNELSIGKLVTAVGLMEELQSQVLYVAHYIQSFITAKTPIKSLTDFIYPDKGYKEAHEKADERSDKGELPLNAAKNTDIGKVKRVTLNNIEFNFENGRELFGGLCFDADKKGVYLIRGESGCGKSTLMNLVLNYHEPKCGEVRINGESVDKIEGLSSIISVFRQEAVFFEDSLRENLRAYKDIDDETLFGLLRRLNLAKFANKEALDRTIRSNESGFSGGEARRLNFLRSLIRNTDILILDEPFANVDEESINAIAEMINETEDRFIFLISHQLPSKVKISLAGELSLQA